jgi:ferredoxin
MNLTADVVAEHSERYPEVQALSAVEEEHRELLPKTFEDGDYGWRDAEWVVQWYGRRFLGGFPDRDRRALEDAYDDNDYEDVHDAISAAVDADTAAGMLAHLTELAGVDVPIGSAFCQFIDPDNYVVIDARQWGILRDAGELDAEYPDPPTAADYERYLETYRAVAERCDCSVWDLYRTLWVLGRE